MKNIATLLLAAILTTGAVYAQTPSCSGTCAYDVMSSLLESSFSYSLPESTNDVKVFCELTYKVYDDANNMIDVQDIDMLGWETSSKSGSIGFTELSMPNRSPELLPGTVKLEVSWQIFWTDDTGKHTIGWSDVAFTFAQF